MESSEEEEVFITCEVCDLPFTGIEPFEQHIKGKKHRKQMKGKKGKRFQVRSEGETKEAEAQDFTCAICETAFSGIIPYTQHLRSKPHAKALRRKEAEEDPENRDNVNSDFELPDDDADLDDLMKEMVPEPFGSCSICEKQFSGPESYHQHVKSKSHAKRKCELKLLRKIKVVLNKSRYVTGASNSEELDKDSEPHLARKEFTPAAEDEELECEECQKVFSGAISFAQHLQSKAHAKRQYQNKLLEELKNIKALEHEDQSSASEDQESGKIPVDIVPSVNPVLTCDICGMAFSGPESAKAHLKSRGHQKATKWKSYLARRCQLAKQGSSHKKDIQQDVVPMVNALVAIIDNAPCGDDETERGSPSGTADTADSIRADGASAPALADGDEECPPYQEQLPGGNLDHENPRDFRPSDVNKKAKLLYPALPDDQDEAGKKKNSPSGNSEQEKKDSCESQSVTSEDEESISSEGEESVKKSDAEATMSSKGTNDDDSSSWDAYHDRRKKSKTAKCKSGVGKLVSTVAKIFD